MADLVPAWRPRLQLVDVVRTKATGLTRTGRAMLEHVVMVVLKQPMDGPLSKALARGGIHTIMDLLRHGQGK